MVCDAFRAAGGCAGTVAETGGAWLSADLWQTVLARGGEAEPDWATAVREAPEAAARAGAARVSLCEAYRDMRRLRLPRARQVRQLPGAAPPGEPRDRRAVWRRCAAGRARPSLGRDQLFSCPGRLELARASFHKEEAITWSHHAACVDRSLGR